MLDPMNRCKKILVLAGCMACLPVFAQDKLTLSEAVRLAVKQNGDLASAYTNVQIARRNVDVAASGFLPTLTPTYRWEGTKGRIETGPGRGKTDRTSRSFDFVASYTLLDSGGRRLNLTSAKVSAVAQLASANQALRALLSQVYTSYYEALRADQLLAVAESQQSRSEETLKATKERFRVGAGPEVEILQAEADFLNARAATISARTRIQTTRFSLKAILGIDKGELAPLDDQVSAPKTAVPSEMADPIALGLSSRPDLDSSRQRLKLAELDVRQAKLDRGIDWSVGLSARAGFADDVSNNGALTIQGSIPLYDGKRTDSLVASRKLALDAARQAYVQQERDVVAEISQAYFEYKQSAIQVEAAELALAAAKKNYEAVSYGKTVGKFNLLSQIQAQVSLTTAETAAVQAKYDALLTEVRLLIATGQDLPGLEHQEIK